MNDHFRRNDVQTVEDMIKHSVAKACCLTCAIVLAGCATDDRRPATLARGVDLFNQNRLEEALPLLRRAAASQPDNAGAHIWLAETYRRLRETEKAVEHARVGLELEP